MDGGNGSNRVLRRATGAVLALVVVMLAACSNDPGTTGKAIMIQSGQAPPGALPTGVPGRASGAAASTTVPLAKQNPTTALFTATGAFQSCLTSMGVTFMGAPNPANPSSPANDPGYIKALGTCAAKSNIVQALKAVQSAQDNLTPAQVKKENKGYLAWRKCMVSRGWSIPQPTPNAKGLLFSFGGGGGGGSGITPPPGQSLLNSSDVQQCAAISQKSTT